MILIKLLTKHAVNDRKVESIRITEINPFFERIKTDVRESRHFSISGFKMQHSTKKMIADRNQAYFKGIPDYVDRTILAEAVFICREITKEKNCFLVSLDTHFSPARKDSHVRDEINKIFGIYCDWPEQIFVKVRELVKPGAKQNL